MTIKAPANGETITYQTVPGFCMGACPTYRFDVNSDGKGLVRYYGGMGEHLGMHPFHVSRARFDAFTAMIRPYRPNGEKVWDGTPPCSQTITDQGEIHISWSKPGGSDRLIFNTGCDAGDMGRMYEALERAPAALGVKHLSAPVVR